jgi:hypothetical protein
MIYRIRNLMMGWKSGIPLVIMDENLKTTYPTCPHIININ